MPAGQAKGGSRREADAPQFAGTGGQGGVTARAFCTLAHRGLHTALPAWAKGGWRQRESPGLDTAAEVLLRSVDALAPPTALALQEGQYAARQVAGFTDPSIH